LRLRCCLSPDRVEVSVLDQGGGFLATTGSHPVIDTSLPDVSAPEVQKREGGFGLGIIDAFADEAEFSPVDGGTSVRFVIYPSGDSEPETP
jgi:anti-sigma regulatory factor (Ser/Thr protein kinase)